jgi:DNA-binding NtrC family response regulator
VEAMKLGAYDYIGKPFDEEELLLKVARALERKALVSEVRDLRAELQGQGGRGKIIAASRQMREVLVVVDQVAPTEATVLIEGESGTGKELFARAIHSMSLRKSRPFVAVNCGALPDTLLESELFGYKAGAFTDAKRDKPGRFAVAEGGTLLLDEIGDVSPAMQVRLLRFLQEKVYEPLGSVQPVRSDVRVIAATNKDLARLVREGGFREDLYYRINIVKLEVPPLRDRMEDVPLLAAHFIERFNSLQGKNITGITEETLACLMAYDFPGNVRELENIIERAFVLCHAGDIEPSLLPPGICTAPAAGEPLPGQDSFKQMEATFLMNALRRHNWNRTKTAKALGIHKTTLFRKIKALGLKPPRH